MQVLSKIFSAELEGVEARRIEVETDLQPGVSAFAIVGLADKALSESKERINAALKNSGVKSPGRDNHRIMVNLAPADVKKTGSQYDVAIALGYLTASGQIRSGALADALVLGELAFDGSLRPVAGALAAAQLAAALHIQALYVPAANAAEAALVPQVRVYPVQNMRQLIEHCDGTAPLSPVSPTLFEAHPPLVASFADIRGQEQAKRALVIAAAGGHNVLMVGSPGSGKTMLAQAILSVLPGPTREEAIEITGVYSAAGMLGAEPYARARPFRAPHQTASASAVFGGGQHPRPGEISLAHRGVLFLDELPEFRRDILESLRQPLESGRAIVSRVRGTVAYPARCMLIAAMNPCPCGYYRDTLKECRCAPYEVLRYQKKISGPLLDRIDIQITVPRVPLDELHAPTKAYAVDDVRAAVEAARAAQRRRHGRGVAYTNHELTSKEIEEYGVLSANARALMLTLSEKALISARGYYRILKVARTIADLAGRESVEKEDVIEAFSYRLREDREAA